MLTWRSFAHTSNTIYVVVVLIALVLFEAKVQYDARGQLAEIKFLEAELSS